MLFARRRSRIRLILVAPVIVFSTQASARRAYRVQLLASYGESSGKLTIAQRLAEAKGRALPPGFPPAPRSFGAPAVPLSVQTSQVAAEANYGLKAATGVTLFPDVQFVGHAAAAKSVPDALVFAGGLAVNF